MAEYIMDLRKTVGHRPLLQCGASVIIFNSDGKVLMLKRTDNDCWCFPGGSVELGETVEETAKREVQEETGFVVEGLKLFDVFSGKDLHYIYPNGDEVYNVDIVFWTSQFSGQLCTCNSESKKGCFFDIKELPQKISPPVVPVVNRLKENYKALLGI